MAVILKRLIPYNGKSHEWPQILAICIACLSCFTLGMLFSWTSPSIPILTSNSSHISPITLEEASYFAVLPPVASIVSGPIFAFLVDVVGRKKMVMFMAVPQMLSFILVAVAEDTLTFYISRLLAGIGEAILFNVLPMYIGEISVPKVRGSWGNLLSITINLGGFVINIIGAYFNIRTTAYICLCVPVLQILLTGLLPESPYFLLMKNRVEDARTSLKKLRWKENVDEELAMLTKDVQRQISESGTLKDLFTIPTNRRALLVGVGIRTAQQLSGLSAFIIYSQYMFNQAGSNFSASASAIIFSGTYVTANAIFASIATRFGRRPLLIFSALGCGVVMVVETVYFYIYEKTNTDVSAFSWLPLAGMLLYNATCSSGLGILPTLMLGELFSASIKGKALYISNIVFSVWVLSSSKIFQSLSSSFGMYVPFCLFMICCFLSAVFVYFYVPETKGKTLEEIQQNLIKHKTIHKFSEDKA